MPSSTTGKTVGAMEFGDHLCLSYDNAEERQAILLSYVRDGLAADHKIIYLSDEDPPETVVDWMSAIPGGGDLDLRGALDSGQFAVRTAEEAYLATGRFDPDEIIALFATEIEVALVQGYKGVRVTGEETFSLRGWPGTDRFAEFERKIDEVFRTSEVSAMAICQYDKRWFDGARLAELESYHVDKVRVDDLHDDGVLRVTRLFAPPGLALSGVVDGASRPALAEILNGLPNDGGLVCLDLSAVDFCDEEGVRLLVGARETADGDARRLLLRGVPPTIASLIREHQLGAAPGVMVEESAQ